MKTTNMRKVPVSKLALSPLNARRAAPTSAETNELKASILACGVLQNLVVHAKRSGGAETFLVACGGRRLAALQALLAEGHIAESFEAPVRVVSAGEAAELSLAENVQRVAMHPADAFEAFATIVEAGSTIEEVATRFGVSPRQVEQRLKLGRLAPSLLAGLRDGTITLETCMALTLSDDHDRQIAVYERAMKDNPYGSASLKHVIRHALAEDRISTTSKLGRAITVEDYEAAGGAMVRDLFSDEEGGEAWFCDPALVRKLVQAKLDAKSEELRSEWKWVEAAIDAEHYRQGWARLHPVPTEPPAELTDEAERLDARAEELEAVEEEDWTDEIGKELDRVFERRDELRHEILSYTAFTPEQRAASGCIVSLGYHGITVAEGILRPEDVAAIQATNEAAQAAAEEAASTCATDPSDEEVTAAAASIPPTVPGQPHGIATTATANAQRNASDDLEDGASSDRPVHSQALAHDLDAPRHQILTAPIAGDYEAA
ncbi:MAG: ParB/RepB/Spo0J family partition protein, partial [Planctomycetota bacterium]